MSMTAPSPLDEDRARKDDAEVVQTVEVNEEVDIARIEKVYR